MKTETRAQLETMEPQPAGRTMGRGDLLVLITVVLWASSFSIIKSAYDEVSPLAFAAVRFVIASVAMLLLLRLLGRSLRVARGDLLRAAAVGIFHVGLYQIFFSTGLNYTTASNSVLIISTAPVITAGLVWLTKAERITRRQVAGMLLALAGVVLLVAESGGISAGYLRGDLLTLLAAAAYAVTPVIALPLLRRYPTITVMTIGMLAGTVVLLAAALPQVAAEDWRLSATAWGQLLFAAVGAGTLAYLFWYEGIARIGPTRVTIYGYLIPVLGVLIAVVVLREGFTALQALGAVVALSGVGLARWPSRAAPARGFASDHYQRHNQRRLAHLASLGLPLEGKSVLEVGAGSGDHTGFFLERECRVLSTDARAENLAVLRNKHPNVRTMRLDLDHPDPRFSEVFDIVYCYGVLYHLSRPAEAIAFMAERCKELLLIETCVSYGEGQVLNPQREDGRSSTQSVSGIGCRPTRAWVVARLKEHFEFVYLPLTQPDHEEFPQDWRTLPQPGALTRSVFIASRLSLNNPSLTEEIRMVQGRA